MKYLLAACLLAATVLPAYAGFTCSTIRGYTTCFDTGGNSITCYAIRGVTYCN